MADTLSILLSTPLFADFTRQETQAALAGLSPRQLPFVRGQLLLRAGEPARWVGVLLEGSALVIQEDFWGGRSILAALGPGQIFAEAFACLPGRPLTVSVEARSAGSALFLDGERLISGGGDSRLLRRLVTDLAGKNLRLNEKLTHMSQPTTRDKVLSYLSAQSGGRAEFDIPFSRQQLADYLGVDRSGLSAQLSRLRQEGVLSFQKSHFRLLKGGASTLPPAGRPGGRGEPEGK